MRSAKSQAAQKIRSFANGSGNNTKPATTTTLPTKKTTVKTTIVSKLAAAPRKSGRNSKPVVKDEEHSDSELSSAPSDIESDYSESLKGESSEDEYTESPFFTSSSQQQSSKKRKRGSGISVEEELSDVKPAKSKSKPKAVKGPKIKREKGVPVEVKYDPPDNWREMYDAIKEMRLRIPAPVDTVGCAKLAEEEVPPKVKRFQHLIALMMSSQTKDTVTGATMKRLQTELPGGLTVESILEVSPTKLNELIGQVGFHNRKTEYIKKAAVVLRDKYNGDIPEKVEDMMALDGVGPKMSYLLEQCAWGKSTGIGVDVHVHRIANMFKWVPQSSEPETTRIYLQSWLPQELWQEINWLLVGFGQSVCLPRGRRCDLCTLGPKSTGGNGMCKASIVVKNKPATPKKIKQEIKFEEDEETEQKVVIKKEEVVEESGFEVTDPLGIDPDIDVKIKTEVIKQETDPAPTDIPDIEDAIGRPTRNTRKKR